MLKSIFSSLGIQGPRGEPGPSGKLPVSVINWKYCSVWEQGTDYGVNNFVTWNDVLYICKKSANSGNEEPDTPNSICWSAVSGEMNKHLSYRTQIHSSDVLRSFYKQCVFPEGSITFEDPPILSLTTSDGTANVLDFDSEGFVIGLESLSEQTLSASLAIDPSTAGETACCFMSGDRVAVVLYDANAQRLQMRRATDEAAQSWDFLMDLTENNNRCLNTTGLTLTDSSMTLIVYFDITDHKIKGLTSSNGVNFSQPFDILTDVILVTGRIQLIENNSKFAMAFVHTYLGDGETTQLSFMYATDLYGEEWSSPIRLDDPSFDARSNNFSLSVINEILSVVYIQYFEDGDSWNAIVYKHALNTNGTTWSDAVLCDNSNEQAFGCNLSQINETPAFVEYEYNQNESTKRLVYRHAINANALEFYRPVTIDVDTVDMDAYDMYPILYESNQMPIIIYLSTSKGSVCICQSKDVNGFKWHEPLEIFDPIFSNDYLGTLSNLSVCFRPNESNNVLPTIVYQTSAGVTRTISAGIRLVDVHVNATPSSI
jgi:sRNA-binding regulator protein Hfq